jgi:hypothetical protein
LRQGDQHVVEHRHALEEPDVLEAPGQAEPHRPPRRQSGDVLALEGDGPGLGGEEPWPVVFRDDVDRVDCACLGKGGYSVPSIVEPDFIEIRRCTADFVLLVEKGTQWNRLSEDKFWRRYNCVLLTGNGQPPRGVRRLARRLHEEYKISV